MAVTMEEIAAMAKVSQTSVSFVLNGKGAGRIAKDKQDLILRLAREHNYRPNSAARGLRNQKRYTIGIIMPTPRNSFYSELVSLIQTRLAVRGYMALFSFWLVREEIKSVYDAVFEHGVDGIIAWDYHECLANEKIPAVIYADKRPGLDAVLLDFDHVADESIAYLHGLGHRDIGYIGLADAPYCIGFGNALRRYGLPAVPEWQVEASGTWAAGAEAMTRLLPLPRRPSAVICLNDSAAIGVISAAVRHGISVPRELSVIGFNNDPASEYMLPPLTTFDPDCGRLADTLIALLLNRLETPDLPECTRRIRPVMVRRESCSAVLKSLKTKE